MPSSLGFMGPESLYDWEGGIVGPLPDKPSTATNEFKLIPYPRDNPPLMTDPATGNKVPIPEQWWTDYQVRGDPNFDPSKFEYGPPQAPEPDDELVFYTFMEDGEKAQMDEPEVYRGQPSSINDITKSNGGSKNNWHEAACKRQGAPRGCDLNAAKEKRKQANADKFRDGGFCPVEW